MGVESAASEARASWDIEVFPAGWLVAPFSEPITARYLRIVIQSSVNGEPFAAMAELDIIPADERK